MWQSPLPGFDAVLDSAIATATAVGQVLEEPPTSFQSLAMSAGVITAGPGAGEGEGEGEGG